VPSYDLIIIDEVESILNQFNSPTFKGKSKDTFIFLEEIIKNSNKLITLDGDINSRAYSFVNSFGDGLYIENEYKKNKKIFNIIDDVDNFDKLLFKSLDNNEKVVIVSQSRTQADIYYKKLKKLMKIWKYYYILASQMMQKNANLMMFIIYGQNVMC